MEMQLTVFLPVEARFVAVYITETITGYQPYVETVDFTIAGSMLLEPTWQNLEDGFHGLFGGDTLSTQAVFEALPPHSVIKLRFRFWTIDTWDAPTD
eukprot:TRINITY_DN3075_c0_g1_i2.p1 TRINITY_DN3075_c0_g1~~TRINITY_DN3075_c0_g1_i2.p1  ORF type:complete len:97 (-),score=16.51 TRINITY_DN3075_c0_g1_i2:36-326(-)